MLAVHPHTLVYSESEVPYQLTGEALSLPTLRYHRVVRVVFAAFGRPISAAAAGIPSTRFAAFSQRFKPDRFFIKLQACAPAVNRRIARTPPPPTSRKTLSHAHTLRMRPLRSTRSPVLGHRWHCNPKGGISVDAVALPAPRACRGAHVPPEE